MKTLGNRIFNVVEIVDTEQIILLSAYSLFLFFFSLFFFFCFFCILLLVPKSCVKVSSVEQVCVGERSEVIGK